MLNDRLEKALDEVKKEMTEGSDTKDTSPPKEKTVAKKTTTKKKVPAKTTAKSTNGDKDLVTLKMLSKELKLEPRDARKKLRAAKVENPGRWSWPESSAGLKAARSALTKSE